MFNRITCGCLRCSGKVNARDEPVEKFIYRSETQNATPKSALLANTKKELPPGRQDIMRVKNGRFSLPDGSVEQDLETEQTEVKVPISSDASFGSRQYDILESRCEEMKIQTKEQNEQIRVLKEENEIIKQEKQALLLRLSDYTSKQLADNNPNIADLGDQNRPTKLVEKFSELYDDEWTEAFEILDKKLSGSAKKPEEEAIKVLFKILQRIYELCKTEASDQLESTFRSIYGLTKRNKDCWPVKRSMKEFKEERKKNYQEFLPDLMQKVENEEEIWDFCGRDVTVYKDYITKATELCWLACIQDPPMALCFSGREGKKFDGNLFKPYTETGKRLRFVVWPAVLLQEGGQILMKGVAQGRKRKKESSVGAIARRSQMHYQNESADIYITENINPKLSQNIRRHAFDETPDQSGSDRVEHTELNACTETSMPLNGSNSHNAGKITEIGVSPNDSQTVKQLGNFHPAPKERRTVKHIGNSYEIHTGMQSQVPKSGSSWGGNAENNIVTVENPPIRREGIPLMVERL